MSHLNISGQCVTHEMPICPKCWMRQHDEIKALKAELAWYRELSEAVKLYSERAHHDTCSHMLSVENYCNCGYDEIRKLLKREPNAEPKP